MRIDELFTESQPGLPGGDRWFNNQLIARLHAGPLSDHSDIEIAVPLARLVHKKFERYGTDGDRELSADDTRVALLALRAIADQLLSLASTRRSETTATSAARGPGRDAPRVACRPGAISCKNCSSRSSTS